jgi:CrcB protein
MLQLLFIGIGGFLGSIIAFLLTKSFNPLLPSLPLGTLLVNTSGCFCIALVFYGITHGRNIPPFIVDFLAFGFIEAYTTMSSVAYDSFKFVEKGDYGIFIMNLAVNLLAALFAVYVGKLLILRLSK